MTIAPNFEEPGLQRARLNTSLAKQKPYCVRSAREWRGQRVGFATPDFRCIERQSMLFVWNPPSRKNYRHRVTDLGVAYSVQRSQLLLSPRS